MNSHGAATTPPPFLFASPDSPADSIAAANLTVPLAGVSRPAAERHRRFAKEHR